MPAYEELWKRRFCFICVIKTATLQFLMAYLSNIELHNWGYMSGLLTRPVDRTKKLLSVFLGESEQAVLRFYWGINGERASVHSHAMEAR